MCLGNDPWSIALNKDNQFNLSVAVLSDIPNYSRFTIVEENGTTDFSQQAMPNNYTVKALIVLHVDSRKLHFGFINIPNRRDFITPTGD